MYFMNSSRLRRGYMLLNVLVIASLATIILTGITSWYVAVYRGSRHVVERENAFQMAEAGIDYYRWHLAHWPTDYKDGTNTAGPYVHDVVNADGEVIGQFSLVITPPPSGSTIVTITSTGTVANNDEVSRTIQTRLAIPSLAKFAVVNDDTVRFGEGTEVFGPLHSNGGIRFDGLAHNVVSSALTTYDDPDHSGAQEYAVHTHVSPTDALPNAPLAARPDVFEAGREIGVPAYDFDGLTLTMASLKTLAQSASGRYIGPSGNNKRGYHIVFAANDTFKLYRVNSLSNPAGSCTNGSNNQSGWGSWTISSETLVGTYNIPSNGVIFVEDHVWVDGIINTARVTVAAARFPESASEYRSIIVNKDLRYTNTDGQDTIALVAQNNVIAGLQSEDDLRIDAALIAQKGFVGRYYYTSNNNCSNYSIRDSLTLYGMIASKERYGFAYTDDTGYIDRTITYDTNLLYAPPPHFPLAGDQYETISWEEIE